MSRIAKGSLFWLSTAGLLYGLWLLLIDSPAEPAILIGAFVAAVGASASELARRQRIANLRFTIGGFAALWRPVASVPGDVMRLLRALPRGRHGPVGRFRAIPFDPAGDPDDDPETGHADAVGNARQAMAELAGSFSPNTFVVGIDVDRRVLLVHQLLPDDAAADSIEPFARAREGDR
jgi:multisubunit Na+/H+ antiporter MnhE subunit